VKTVPAGLAHVRLSRAPSVRGRAAALAAALAAAAAAADADAARVPGPDRRDAAGSLLARLWRSLSEASEPSGTCPRAATRFSLSA